MTEAELLKRATDYPCPICGASALLEVRYSAVHPYYEHLIRCERSLTHFSSARRTAAIVVEQETVPDMTFSRVREELFFLWTEDRPTK